MRRFGLLLALSVSSVCGEGLDGRWTASATVNQLQIPFEIEFSGSRSQIVGSFFNGDEKVSSTRGNFDGKSLTLHFDSYATVLNASLENGTLRGFYDRGPKGKYAIEAKRASPIPMSSVDTPPIAGLWEIGGVRSAKGEKTWRLVVQQSGPVVQAAILRIDGDTGVLKGTLQDDGSYLVSHFSGARPSLFRFKPENDGTLTVLQYGALPEPDRFTAVRSSIARAKGLPSANDPAHHTTVRDAAEVFAFSGPDLNGKLVSNEDARFRNKVLIVAVGGSWCPNCHDEAPFLMELYRKYHAAGLEIVSLSFEEEEQLKDLSRLRAFIQEYGIEYPVLVPGEPSELQAKLPQAVNLNSWPTAFFIGRDGRVRGVHAGFAGRASGELHTEMRNDIENTLQRLLSEGLRTSRE